jgi:hypothetical protein
MNLSHHGYPRISQSMTSSMATRFLSERDCDPSVDCAIAQTMPKTDMRLMYRGASYLGRR